MSCSSRGGLLHRLGILPPKIRGLQVGKEEHSIKNGGSGIVSPIGGRRKRRPEHNLVFSLGARQMTFILILGTAAGVILGFRQFKVWALAPLVVFISSGVVANGIANGLDRRDIIIALLAGFAGPQIGYLMSFARSLITPQPLCPDHESRLCLRDDGPVQGVATTCIAVLARDAAPPLVLTRVAYAAARGCLVSGSAAASSERRTSTLSEPLIIPLGDVKTKPWRPLPSRALARSSRYRLART